MPSKSHSALEEAAVLDKLEQISAILDTFHYVKGLQRNTIAVIKALCEQGVNPQALSQVIKFLRREAAATPQQS